MEKKIIYVASSDQFEKAFENLSDGGTIVLTADITAKHTRLSKHGGIITVTGKKLVFAESVTITLGGETIFENITIDVVTSGVIAADYHPLTFGEGVTVNSDLTEESNGLYLVGGENNAPNTMDAYAADPCITLHSGTVSRVVAFSRGCVGRVHSGHATLEVAGDAYVRYVIAGAMGEGASAGSASLRIGGDAVIEALLMGGKKENFLTGDMDIFADGGDIYRFDAVGLTAVHGKKNLVYDPRTAADGLVFLAYLAQFDSVQTICETGTHTFGAPVANPFDASMQVHTCTICGHTEVIGDTPRQTDAGVVFVADGGFGDGTSPSCPCDSYADALKSLGDAGGTVVLVGVCTLPVNLIDRFEKTADAYQEPCHSGEILVTSLYGGTDYRERGAKLVFAKSMDYRMSGPVTFDGIMFAAADDAKHNRIVARYHPLVIGEDCETPVRDGYMLDIIGGYLQFRYTDLDGYTIENAYEEIVNAHRPLPVDFAIDDPVPIDISPKFTLRREAAEAFNRMYADMAAEGLKLPHISDASRTYARQYALFTGYLCRLRRTFGYDFQTARRVVLRSCGLPTCSEHQQGVAVDMYDADMVQYGSKKHHYYDITPEWAWVRENGAKYGIVLRYPDDKTDITGCIYEAWHFRYVGKAVATVLKVRGYSLEEYMGAKLGAFHRDAHVTVKSGVFHSVTAFSRETGLIQLTGKHFLSVADGVAIAQKSEEASEC